MGLGYRLPRASIPLLDPGSNIVTYCRLPARSIAKLYTMDQPCPGIAHPAECNHRRRQVRHRGWGYKRCVKFLLTPPFSYGTLLAVQNSDEGHDY